jgi:hypothetical protein
MVEETEPIADVISQIRKPIDMKRKLSFCYSKTHECGCTDIHWFWLFGHKYEPNWAICTDHIRELLATGIRIPKEKDE